MDPDGLSVDKAVLGLVPEETCRKHTLVPLHLIERTLFVAIAEPSNLFALDDVTFMTGFTVEPVQAAQASIVDAIDRLYGPKLPPVEEKASPAIAVVNRMLLDAIERGATCVHVDPFPAGLRVSFRIDGMMQEVERVPGTLADAIVSRLKIMSGLDIAERWLPQDGRVTLKLPDGRTKTFMLCTLPTVHGERLVLRFNVELARIALDDLGFSPGVLAQIKRAIQLPSGLTLIAGAPGSGRSTTLYSLVAHLDTGTRCILTAEERLDAPLASVVQTVINPGRGYTHGAALRSFARQDADVVMLSGIPDAETADVLTDVASNDFAVISAIEADDAPRALLALARLGSDPARAASPVRCVLAQRLMRRVCGQCSSAAQASDDDRAHLAAAGVEVPSGAAFLRAKGCSACRHSGYRGRVAIGEMLVCSDRVKAAVAAGVPAGELRDIAVNDGMLTFAAEALDAALAGKTTIDECLRVLAEIPAC